MIGTGRWPVPDNVRALLQGEDDGDFKGGAAGRQRVPWR